MSDRGMEILGADKIRDIFEEIFDDVVGSIHSLSDAEVTVSKEDGEMIIDVLLTGMAGSPPVDSFKQGNVEEANEIIFSSEGYDDVVFELMHDEIVMLNVNDYMLRYKKA